MYQSQEPKHGFVVPNLLMPFVAALAVANSGTFHKVKIQVCYDNFSIKHINAACSFISKKDISIF